MSTALRCTLPTCIVYHSPALCTIVHLGAQWGPVSVRSHCMDASQGTCKKPTLFVHIWWCIRACLTTSYKSRFTMYTLPHKKHNFSKSIFPGDPGSVLVTQGHEHYTEWLNKAIFKSVDCRDQYFKFCNL